MFFEKKVDLRSKKAMVDFLAGHFRYYTMNSWNRMTSYANCIKVHRLGLSRDQNSRVWDLLDTDYWDEIRYPIDDFTEETGGCYTIGTNGRSGGYLVLYRSEYEVTGHKSWCRTCGQRSFAKVVAPRDGAEGIILAELIRTQFTFRAETYLTQSAIEALDLSEDEKLALIRKLQNEFEGRDRSITLDNRCGRCGAVGEGGRVNYARGEPVTLRVSTKGIDDDLGLDDLMDLSVSDLRNKVELVCRFDRACDEIREAFIDIVDNCVVVEETVMVPKTVRRILCATA